MLSSIPENLPNIYYLCLLVCASSTAQHKTRLSTHPNAFLIRSSNHSRDVQFSVLLKDEMACKCFC